MYKLATRGRISTWSGRRRARPSRYFLIVAKPLAGTESCSRAPPIENDRRLGRGAGVVHDRDDAAVRVLERERVAAAADRDPLRARVDVLREVAEDVVGRRRGQLLRPRSTISSAFCGQSRPASMPLPIVSSTMFQALYEVTPALIQSRIRPQVSIAVRVIVRRLVAVNGLAQCVPRVVAALVLGLQDRQVLRRQRRHDRQACSTAGRSP